MKKLFLTAATLLALSAPASAALITDLGTDPNTGLNHTPGAGPFGDQWTFSLSLGFDDHHRRNPQYLSGRAEHFGVHY